MKIPPWIRSALGPLSCPLTLFPGQINTLQRGPVSWTRPPSISLAWRKVEVSWLQGLWSWSYGPLLPFLCALFVSFT